MIRENFKRYARSTAITEFKEFPKRSHLIATQDGWQEVAEYALSWAETKMGGGVLQKAACRNHVLILGKGESHDTDS